ncbi:hypothetical protein [uncultured Erythrobacter sp.]|uniref:hypothetical protein n=1 Tax=uncultured Erythrobacter sp. TaxID=263913 RepID=UPI002601A925|nr:hypothetical protein [uncultured Erythrobacter sp.]
MTGNNPGDNIPDAAQSGAASAEDGEEAATAQQVTLATIIIFAIVAIVLVVNGLALYNSLSQNWEGGGWSVIAWTANGLAGWSAITALLGSLASAVILIFTEAHRKSNLMIWLGLTFGVALLLSVINFYHSTNFEPQAERQSPAAKIGSTDNLPGCLLEDAPAGLRDDERSAWRQECRIGKAQEFRDTLSSFWKALLAWLIASLGSLFVRRTKPAQAVREKLQELRASGN